MCQNKPGTQTAVSVIIPVYNSENYLSACIESILTQDFEDFELLLIDDGSSDSSPVICDQFAQKDARVKVFHKENGGICEARNFGMEHATGEYIAFSDHDDLVLPGFLKENYLAAAESCADIVKFGRKELWVQGEENLLGNVRQFEERMMTHAELSDAFFDLRLSGAMNCVWDAFFRKDFLVNHGIYFDTRYLKGGEDVDFCSRCFASAERILMRPLVYYEHYIRVGFSTSTVEDPNRMQKYKDMTENLIACASLTNANPQKHAAAYLSCIVKEEVYPSVKYLLLTGKSIGEISSCLQGIYEKSEIPKVNLRELRQASHKWGLFACLFYRHRFLAIILLVRLNLLKKKMKGSHV